MLFTWRSSLVSLSFSWNGQTFFEIKYFVPHFGNISNNQMMSMLIFDTGMFDFYFKQILLLLVVCKMENRD